jgi:predicted transcriptional regulator
MADLQSLTAQIVANYVEGNKLSAENLPVVISSVYVALAGADQPEAPAEGAVELPSKAQIKKSIQPDHLVSFIDGKTYKTLKRHLTTHGLTFDEYKAKYGLPKDYPTVAPSYSAQRSELAKKLGLGQGGRGGVGKAKAAAEPAKATKGAKKARGGAAGGNG